MLKTVYKLSFKWNFIWKIKIIFFPIPLNPIVNGLGLWLWPGGKNKQKFLPEKWAVAKLQNKYKSLMLFYGQK
jgi:hypothetical protein